MCDYLYKDGHVCGKKLSPKYDNVACYRHRLKPRGHMPCRRCHTPTIAPKGVCTPCASKGDYIRAYRQKKKEQKTTAEAEAMLREAVEEILGWDWGEFAAAKTLAPAHRNGCNEHPSE